MVLPPNILPEPLFFSFQERMIKGTIPCHDGVDKFVYIADYTDITYLLHNIKKIDVTDMHAIILGRIGNI
jgi:hypothetical protein